MNAAEAVVVIGDGLRFGFMILGFVTFVAVALAALVGGAAEFSHWWRHRRDMDEFEAARPAGVGDLRAAPEEIPIHEEVRRHNVTLRDLKVALTADPSQFQSGMAAAGRAARAERCRSGRHLRTRANTYVNPNTGKRYCRDCRREREAS